LSESKNDNHWISRLNFDDEGIYSDTPDYFTCKKNTKRNIKHNLPMKACNLRWHSADDKQKQTFTHS
jgi:hypothetical protein